MIKKYGRGLLALVFFMTIVTIRNINLDKIPLLVKIMPLVATPIFFIWLAFKYGKSGKARKYRLIAFSCAGILCYVTAIAGFLDKYYPKVSEKYHSILAVLIIGNLFLTVIVGFVCNCKVREYEGYNNRLK